MKPNIQRAVLAFSLMAVLFSFPFQNCAPVQVSDIASEKPVTRTGAPDPVPPSAPKDCENGTRKHLETWFVPDGTSPMSVPCLEGTGNRYEIYTQEKQVRCFDGVVSATGEQRSNSSGQIIGECNLDCGARKNNETWWMEVDPTSTMKACPTALNLNLTLNYKNEVQYKCEKGMVKAIDTRQTLLNPQECPPLTFNNQDSMATVAYEDIYPGPGDADYNDFVANIKVQETYNSLEELSKIQIEYYPRIKLAGYFAQFVLVFDGQVRGRGGFVSNVKDFKSLPMFEGSAQIKYELFDAQGNLIKSVDNVPKDQDLIVFDDTSAAVSQKPKAVITITKLDPVANTFSKRGGLSIKRYRSVLDVKADNVTRYDIDLSDINPTMFDSRLQPLAFFVPVSWKPPGATVNILIPYPDFKKHSEYLYSRQPLESEPVTSREWYKNLANESAVISP